MYLAALVTGIRPLPDLLSEPVLALMPRPVFGFLIDRLQHLGKVLEEAVAHLQKQPETHLAALELMEADVHCSIIGKRLVRSSGSQPWPRSRR